MLCTSLELDGGMAMPRRKVGKNVFDEGVSRMSDVYKAGSRVICSFSGGKDSTVCLELCIIAARETGRLPVEVIMRDDEIMFPGTFEYAERVAARPEVKFHWVYACQPVINVFNRECPYFWVFDPLLDPDRWVRQPPAFAKRIDELNIEALISPKRFPVADGQRIVEVLGLRGDESLQRMLGVFSSKGYMAGARRDGVEKCRPIYDWRDWDVWRAMKEFKWDYNEAYDVMARVGIKRSLMRIAPPTMNPMGVATLSMAMNAWPVWFDRVAKRLPGARTAANFGLRAVRPLKYLGESWQECYRRTCIETAPKWIAERSMYVMEYYLRSHSTHSVTPFPESAHCHSCPGKMGSWRKLAQVMYLGDPFTSKMAGVLKCVEPEYFRPGSGFWNGSPTFA